MTLNPVDIIGLFNSSHCADLDTLAQQLQQQRTRFTGGAWRLHIFFGTLSSPGSPTATDAAWQAHIVKLEQWAAGSPASPTPRIALARGTAHIAPITHHGRSTLLGTGLAEGSILPRIIQRAGNLSAR